MFLPLSAMGWSVISGLKVIKLEFILRLKIKGNDWLLADMCPQRKKGCKDQESIQSSTIPDPGYQWESDKLTVRHRKREPRGQPLPSK